MKNGLRNLARTVAAAVASVAMIAGLGAAPANAAAGAETINGWTKGEFVAAAVRESGIARELASEIWGDELRMAAVGVESTEVVSQTERRPTPADYRAAENEGIVPLLMMSTSHDRTIRNVFGHVVRQLIIYKDFACGSDSFRTLGTSYYVDANSAVGESFTGLAGSQDYYNSARTTHTSYRNAHFENLYVPDSSNLWVQITVTSSCGVTKSAGGT